MEARISKHMNDDHSDSLLAWAHFYAKLPTATHATATTLTDQGFGLDVTLANGTVTEDARGEGKQLWLIDHKVNKLQFTI